MLRKEDFGGREVNSYRDAALQEGFGKLRRGRDRGRAARRREGKIMLKWKKALDDFFNTIESPVFGAGFKKPGTDVSSHPRLVSFDGHSVYFFGMKEKEAARLLDGITLASGRTGWLAYILQEVFYDDRAGDELYEALFDGLDSGRLKAPGVLSRESIYQWVESIAPEVERIKGKAGGTEE